MEVLRDAFFMIELRYPVFQSAPWMYGPFSVFQARVYIVSVYVIDDVLVDS